MWLLQSAQPNLKLRRFVRAYAQRTASIPGEPISESVPARLEPTLEFEFGDTFDVTFTDGNRLTTPLCTIVGPQTHLRGSVLLAGSVESFAIFFQPAGFTQLFGIPLRELMDRAYDATTVVGTEVRGLWHRLKACASFSERIALVERVLL
jgi:hypothetical protein